MTTIDVPSDFLQTSRSAQTILTAVVKVMKEHAEEKRAAFSRADEGEIAVVETTILQLRSFNESDAAHELQRELNRDQLRPVDYRPSKDTVSEVDWINIVRRAFRDSAAPLLP